MGSPVQLQFSSFIKIDRSKEDAVYLQIVYQLINAVKSRLLEVGDRLPGSRKIAAQLEIHRKTVVAALTELQEQGWIETRPNIGAFIKNPEWSAEKASPSKGILQQLETASYEFRKEFILDTPVEENSATYLFNDGTPDYRIIKPEELVRFYGSVLRRKTKIGAVLSQGDGSIFFREQLSYYLNLTHGLHLSRHHLLPIAHLEQTLSILSRLLIQPGDIVLAEEWSYFLPNMIFSQAGAKLKTVPVDAQGMDVDYIEKHFTPGDICCIYLNTQSQYPTTVRLSEERKTKLLHLAQIYNFVIIEIDTDFEFRSLKNKNESLFRKDGGKNVLYIGAFGRFLNPGFQMNFLIAPKDLLVEAEKYLSIFGRPDPMMEKALGEIIHQGDIHRYRRKAQKLVEERKERFAQLLLHYFQEDIHFDIPPSGLAFWVRFKKSFSLIQLQEKALGKELFLAGICLFQNRNLTALRLGFAHLHEEEMETAVGLLAEAYHTLIE